MTVFTNASSLSVPASCGAVFQKRPLPRRVTVFWGALVSTRLAVLSVSDSCLPVSVTVQAQYELPQTDKLDAEGLAALLPLLLRNGQDKPE